MLRLNKRIDYGILLLTALGEPGEERVSAAEVSKTFQLSRHMAANILKALGKAGLVQAGRGVRGGYTLARSPESIRLIDVIEALEGPFALLDCCVEVGGTPPSCSTTTAALCTARPVMQKLNQRLRGLLEEITVADFAGQGLGASAPPHPEQVEA